MKDKESATFKTRLQTVQVDCGGRATSTQKKRKNETSKRKILQKVPQLSKPNKNFGTSMEDWTSSKI